MKNDDIPSIVDYDYPELWPVVYFVYCYKNNINNKVYIGKTNNISQRKSRHRRNAFIDNSPLPFYRALRKYGEDNFTFTILDQFYSEDIIFDLEKFYIKNYKATNPNFGYNITDGGEGASGTRHNENQKKANALKFGTNNGNSKLNDALVYSIYNDYKTGNYTIATIAQKYNIALITAERLLSGKSWKHLNLDILSLKDIKFKNVHGSNGRSSK